MNCQDIARILDEQEVDGLLSEELSDVQAHLAACSECARAWKIHAQLTSMEIPAVPKELRAFYSPQTVSASHAGAYRRGRFVLIGVVVAVAAAAAMLTAQLTESAAPEAATGSSTPTESSAMRAGVDASSSSGADAPAQESGQPMKEAQPVRMGERATTAGLRILLLPPRFDSGDAAARPAIEGFHSSLLQALRKLPDVTVDLASAASSAEPLANRITVVSPEVTTLPLGQLSYRVGSGSCNWTGYTEASPAWAVEVMVEPANSRSGSAFSGGGTFSTLLFVDIGGMPVAKGSCGGNSMSARPVCSNVDQLAERLVWTLQEKLESASDPARLTSRLSDVSLTKGERRAAFMKLLRRSRQPGVVLDITAIDAIRAYLAQTLASKSLPASERLAPVVLGVGVLDMGVVAGRDTNATTKAFLGEVTRHFLDIYRDLRAEDRPPAIGGFPGQQQENIATLREFVRLLTTANPSAAVDLQVRILTDNPQPSSPLALQALAALIDKRDDPRVSRVLDGIAAGKSGAELRGELESRLALSQQRSGPTTAKVVTTAGESIFYMLMGAEQDPMYWYSRFGGASVSQEEVEKLIAYAKYAKAANRDFQTRETARMCVGKSALTTLDTVAAALTKHDASSAANREQLGNEAAGVLGERLGKLLQAAVRTSPNGYRSITDHRNMMISLNRQPVALIESVCSNSSAPVP